jgi:hypothetical protein
MSGGGRGRERSGPRQTIDIPAKREQRLCARRRQHAIPVSEVLLARPQL